MEACSPNKELCEEILSRYPERLSSSRRNGVLFLLRLMGERNSQVLVETGTMRRLDGWRGDGGLTWFLAKHAARAGGRLHTVDTCKEALAISREATKELAGHVSYHYSDSVKFLENFGQPIDCLLLDSLDYRPGREKAAQKHNLAEVRAAWAFLHSQSIIVIDDCSVDHGGKGGLSVPYLTARRWRIAHKGYMIVLVLEA